jgi:hypothetical protein
MFGDPPPAPPPPPGNSLNILNTAANLDFRTAYNHLYIDHDIENDPYSNLQLNSKFYDMDSLPSILQDDSSPIFLSINSEFN